VADYTVLGSNLVFFFSSTISDMAGRETISNSLKNETTTKSLSFEDVRSLMATMKEEPSEKSYVGPNLVQCWHDGKCWQLFQNHCI